jgi:hypothetical protein
MPERERVDTAAGAAWLESGGTDWWLVYDAEEGRQPVGNVFEHGTHINEPAYSWAAGAADSRDAAEGVEPSREDAVAAVLRSNA